VLSHAEVWFPLSSAKGLLPSEFPSRSCLSNALKCVSFGNLILRRRLSLIYVHISQLYRDADEFLCIV